MIYLICNAIFLQNFIIVTVGLKISSVPQIYPQKNHVVVDAHTDLVLGCRGAEPLRWTFHDDVNNLHYNSSYSNITFMNNTIELEYKFETILTIYNVSHVNVGFYYCHGEKTDFDTSRRSNRIYVFVHDSNNLSIITYEKNEVESYLWFIAIPCRPTSPDINITLTCDGNVSMSVIPSNYSKLQQTEDNTVRFNPYDGFTARGELGPAFRYCSCYFEREDRSYAMKADVAALYYYYIFYPLIGGSDTVNVGENIILHCVSLVEQYRLYSKYWLQWNTPNGTNAMINHYTVKLKYYVLYISVLTIKKVSSDDEGYYRCTVAEYTDMIANKYVTVHDKQVSPSPPRIYSTNLGQKDIQVISGDNITLRCEGVRPITWSWDKKSESYNKERNIKLENGLYILYLHLTSVHYNDTGFYYCHENGSIREHTLKSKNIYIFVKDEHNLHVPQDKAKYFPYAYDNATVPCRPTSRDVNVTLSMMQKIYIASTRKLEAPRGIDPVIFAYDPREGFTIQLPQAGDLTVTCTFVSETANSTLEFIYSIGPIPSELHLEGPREDLVFVGDSLELTCTVFVPHKVSDDALSWKIQNNSSRSDIILEKINVFGGKVLISKLFVYNVKNIDENRYFCYFPYKNTTASKFISVYDNFETKLYIENLTYHYAYIGQPLTLRCGVNVSHNDDFNMAWTAPNTTKTHMRIVDTEYTLEVRHRNGHIILKIDNVTYENEGYYSCFVSDLIDRKENVTKYVQVKRGKVPTMRIAPSHVNNPEEIDVLIGDTAKLTCPAEGDPIPTITWMKGSTRVQSFGQRIDFSADNSEFTILLVQRFHAGLYTCVARNPYGQISRVVNLRVKSVSFSGMIVGIIVLTIAVIAVAAAFAKFEYKKKRRRRALLEDGFDNFKFSEAEQPALSGYDTKWEIPRNKIKIGRNLGSGYFGVVLEATVSNYFDKESIKTVAVKMLHKNCNNITALHSLLSELQILVHLGKHPNLINLLGACTENIADRSLLVVIEYCEHGSLRSYLLENRSNFVNLIDSDTELITNIEDAKARAGDSGPVNTLQLVRWALQVARGMEFLASRKVVHGDLAARNVLLAENYVVKITDFGLSRNLSSNEYYRKRSQCPLPIKWMALETIRDKTFSTWSDVWSFGVVLWELFSLARTPYADLEPDFRFYRKLESGYRLDKPQYSTREIYQLMRDCWCAQPQRRPTFPCLVHTLDDLLQDVHTRCTRSQNHYVNVSGECLTAVSSRSDDNTTAEAWIALDVLTSTETGSNNIIP